MPGILMGYNDDPIRFQHSFSEVILVFAITPRCSRFYLVFMSSLVYGGGTFILGAVTCLAESLSI